jgi:SAM-dependent methyltransferase
MAQTEMEKIYLERYPKELEKDRFLYAKQSLKWMIEKGIIPANKDIKILDLGCGTGLVYYALKNLGFTQVYGTDKEKFFPEVILGDVEKGIKGIKDKSFDLIIARDVIEHIRNPDIFFKEAYRMLKDGGRAIILTPATERLYVGEFYDGYDHKSPFTRVSLAEGFRLFGFKKIKVRYLRAFPFFWKYYTRAFDYVYSKKRCYVLGWAEK